MLAPQIAPARPFVYVAIFHQRRRLFRRARAQIEPHQRLRARGLAPHHEFVGAELVAVDGIPRFVQHARAVLLRSHPIQPVVPGDKVAAGVAHDGNSQLPYFVDHVLAQSVGIGVFRAWIVNPFIDGASQVFQE